VIHFADHRLLEQQDAPRFLQPQRQYDLVRELRIRSNCSRQSCGPNSSTADVRCRTARDYRGAQAATVKSKPRRSKPAPQASANRLIAALPRRSQSTFLARCEEVELEFATVLCVEGKPMEHVYLPEDSVISLVTVLADGARLEVGIIGNEGMLGTSILLGVNVSPLRAVVQGSGSALRMSAATFRRLCKQDVDLRQLMNRYVHVLMEQLAQTAACTRYHRVESRLARWLLMTRDRVANDRFHLTHEFLAYMLGVRRAGVTHAARSLHARSLIEYRRGAITVLDAAGLRKASCACYVRGNRIYERTLGSVR
jgi:CRP-like cAMP-binding protein